MNVADAIDVATAFGAAALLAAALAPWRGARVAVPLLVLLAVGGAAFRGMLARSWALDSLVHDAPWGAALVLAAWAAAQGAAISRLRSWPAVVLGAALIGDLGVALGLAFTEPDRDRRARLVLAASGASLIGVTSGAAPLMLGWGGLEAVALGLVLAFVGWAGGGGAPATARPDARGAAFAAGIALCGAVLTWTLALSGVLEAGALRLEALPYWAPRQASGVVAGMGLFAGAIGDEGLVALYTREVLTRALSLHDEDTRTLLRAGLAVGGGLPMLLMTRARLRVGLPLWLVQIAVFVAWVFLR